MTEPAIRVGGLTVVLALTLVIGGVTACSRPVAAGGTTPASSPPAVSEPLATTTVTAGGATAVVAMGTLDDPLNTFWQLFVRTDATSPWTLSTPPGVADNGGLVASAVPDAAGGLSILAGFEPSQWLHYSPLALRSAHGGWSPGIVPGDLAAVPDALASEAGSASGPGAMVALLRGSGGTVERSGGNITKWSTVVDERGLAASTGGRSCGVGQLTAVALDGQGDPLVASTCRRGGVVGIFEQHGGTWQRVGPRLTGTPGSEPTQVVRMATGGGVVSALVASSEGSTTRLVALRSAADGAWTRSPPLVLPAGTRLRSTGVAPDDGFAVLTSRGDDVSTLDREAASGASWESVGSPPTGTVAVAAGPGNQIDALTVRSTRLTDWRLTATDGTMGRWRRVETVTVPIQFGSSD